MTNRLRLLITTQHYEPEITACAFRWGALARAMAAEGADVTVLTCFPNYPSGRIAPGYMNSLRSVEEASEKTGGVRIVRVLTHPASEAGILDRTLSQLTFLLSGANALRKEYDVVLGTSPPLASAELGARLAGHFGLPFVMEVRDLWPDVIYDTGYSRLRPLAPLLYAWERSLYRRSSLVTTVTPSFLPLLEAKGVPPSRLRVFPPSIDPSALIPPRPADVEALRARLGLEGKRVALYLGNHAVSQGLEVVVDAAQFLGSDIHLLFVGDGWERPALIERANRLKATNVSFLSAVQRSDVPTFYALADVCLVTLRNTGFMQHFLPSKLIEVLAHGKPVLTNIGGCGADLVRELGAGRVLAEYSPESVAEALRTMLGGETPPAHDAADVSRAVMERFSTRAVASDYLSCLLSLR